jgi:aromatic-amino-acid transaminase
LNNEKGINIVLNDPIHNPTGIVLTKQQYIVICKFLNTFKNKTINLILDTAYIDYLNNNNNKHDIFSYISSLDKNINVYVCYSFSKTLCIYGLRVASLVILSKNSEQIYLELQEKIKSTVFRCSSSGIYVVNKILSSKTLLTQYKKQLSNIKKMLLKRMTLFLSEAKKCNLSYVNCSSGFFVTVLCKNPSVIVEQLPNYKSVLRAQNNSLRIGICGMTCSQIKGLAEKIKALTTK